MSARKSTQPLDAAPEIVPSPVARSFLTLFLLFHLFCLGLVLTTNHLPFSPLQQRLLAVAAPYTQPLRLELFFAPYYLTHGAEWDDDHFLEVEVEKGPQAGQKFTLPDEDLFGLARSDRYQSLGRVMAGNAYQQNDAVCGEFAKAVGAGFLSQQPERKSVVVRVRRRRYQPYEYERNVKENPPNPRDPAYLSTAYEARVWRDRDGDVQVLKLSSASEVAPLEQGARP